MMMQNSDSVKVAQSCSNASPSKTAVCASNSSTPTCDADSKAVTPTSQSFDLSQTLKRQKQFQELSNSSSSSPYTEIRELDSQTRWSARNEVITSLEHRENTEVVRSILGQVLQELPQHSREQSESSTSSEISIPNKACSPCNSCYLSTGNSPEPQRGSSSANSSVYYSLSDTTPEDLSGTESDTSLDVTVYVRENRHSDSKTPLNSVDTLLGLATPVNSSRSRTNEESSEPLCSSSFIETAHSVRKHFDKTFPTENTVILKEKQNDSVSTAEFSIDLLGEEEFVRSDLVNFDILPKFDSPLRRDTFSIGLNLKNLPADENILKPAHFAFESELGANLPVASNYSDKSRINDTTPVNRNCSEDLLVELEDPLLDKTVSGVDDNLFGVPVETNKVEVANKTFEPSDFAADPGILEKGFTTHTETPPVNFKCVEEEKAEELKKGEVDKFESEDNVLKMATVYDDDFDFNSISDPFKSSSNMMADSPPLPRRNIEMSYDDIDYDAIENPFASSKKMMMDSPPNNDSPIANDLPPPPPALHEENNVLDSSREQENSSGVSMNGSATITRPSAHARTKTKVPPHKARRSANTKLSSQAEVTAQLTGSGDAPAEVVKPVDGYSTATLVKKRATPPPPPKRSSTAAQVVAACPVSTVLEASSVSVTEDLSSESLPPPPPPVTTANNDKTSADIYDDDFDFNSIANPFESSNKMMADSPPLPRRNTEMNYDDIDYDAIENPFASSKKMMMDSPPNNDSPIANDLPPPPPALHEDNEIDFDAIKDPFASSKKMMMDSPPNDSPINKSLPPPPPGLDDEIDFSTIKDPFASSKKMMLDSPDVEFPPPPTLEELGDSEKSVAASGAEDVTADSQSRRGNETSFDNISADDVINGTEGAADIREESSKSSARENINSSHSHLEPGFDVSNEGMDQLMNSTDNLPDEIETEPQFPPSEQVTPAFKATKTSSKLVANSTTVERPRTKRGVTARLDQASSNNQSSANSSDSYPEGRDEVEENNNVGSRLHRKGNSSNNTEGSKDFDDSRGSSEDMKIKEGQQETQLSNSRVTSNHVYDDDDDDDCDGLHPKLPYDEMFNQVSSTMLNERHAESLKEMEALRQDYAELEQEKCFLVDEKKAFIQLLQDLEDTFAQVCVLKDKLIAQRDEENIRLVKESEEAQSDLKSLEQSFDQAHKRYNKLRDTIEHYKQNEQLYVQEMQRARHKIQEEEKMYQTLKVHTEERFREAERQSQEAEKLARGAIMKLEMEQKKLLMANEALQLSYDQKVKENQELNELCENLISKLAERDSIN